jgi:hypothetical protein
MVAPGVGSMAELTDRMNAASYRGIATAVYVSKANQ